MLKIAPNPFFWTTASFAAPNEQGEMKEVKLRVKLAFMDDQQYKKELESVHGSDHPDRALAVKLLQGWDATQIDSGSAPADFSVDLRDRLFSAYRALPTAIVKAWVAGHHGAMEGN